MGRGGGRRHARLAREVVGRGEVWWADLPATGRRPVLVVTRAAAIPVLKRVVVVPATRTVRGIPTEVPLGPEDGMPEHCALSFDNVVTLPKTALAERICTLGSERLDEVCRAWNDVVDC